MVLDAGERLLKNTNAVNQANVLAAPYRTIQFFSDIISMLAILRRLSCTKLETRLLRWGFVRPHCTVYTLHSLTDSFSAYCYYYVYPAVANKGKTNEAEG